VSGSAERDTIVIALRVGDAALADRLAALLGEVVGLRLAAAGERADIEIVDAGATHEADNLEVTLTPREAEVLALLAEGASNKTIARQLGISLHTAKFHVSQLLNKLDASGRTDAVAHAARLGVLHL
jgi:DNA-binding CsgD family transcriptional regulator